MPTRVGMRTTPAAVTSKILGPAARNTDAASSGFTRIASTCSRVSSGLLAVVADMGAPEALVETVSAPGTRPYA